MDPLCGGPTIGWLCDEGGGAFEFPFVVVLFMPGMPFGPGPGPKPEPFWGVNDIVRPHRGGGAGCVS